jgi:hypothetical protein
MRVKRGTLRSERKEGTVYVVLEADQTRPDADQSGGLAPDQSALVASLEDQVRFLREELARKDAIMLRLTESIGQLEAPRESRASPGPDDTATDTPVPSGGPQTAAERPQQPRSWRSPVDKLPWWQYVLGLGLVAGLGILVSLESVANFVTSNFGNSIAIVFALVLLVWASPGIFGLYVGLKRRNLSLWRHLVPIGAIAGAAAALTAAPGLADDPSIRGGELPVLVTGLIFFPYVLFYVSGATIGRALQRRTAGAFADLPPDTEAPPSSPRQRAPGDRWSPRRQAILGFAGTVVAALISFIGTLVTVLAGSD